MARTRTCPKCQSSMSEGFIVDNSDSGRSAVSRWVEGTPEKSIWSGIKVKGRTTIDIATWRCSSCGFLESYAGGR